MAYTPEELKKLKIRQSLKRRLWAAMIAEDSFRKVRFSAQYYIDNSLHTTHPLHYTFLSSIVVNYCKIFSGGSTVPNLPDKFAKFDDTVLQLAHDALLVARNNIYAHPDSNFMRYELTAKVWLEPPQGTKMW